MKPISDSVYGKLMAQGLRSYPAGTGVEALNKSPARSSMARGGGVAAGRREEGDDSPPIGHAGEDRRPMGIGKDADRSPRQGYRVNNSSETIGGPFLRLVAVNMDAMPMRKATRRGAVFLMCIDGGRI